MKRTSGSRTATNRKQREAAWFGDAVAPGTSESLSVVISETYSGADVRIPVRVWRAAQPGPVVFITGAIHGDEINGTGAIRHLIRERPFELQRGTLLLVPVVNLFGFDRHERYLPDRRDLNRCFPGSRDGSLAKRLAHAVFEQIIRRADFGIDLHSAAQRRTNFPNLRADLKDHRLAELARAFGAELILNGMGPVGSLRRSAAKAGCPTMVFEAGEVGKVEPGVVSYAVRGIHNVLRSLGMVEGTASEPLYRLEADATKWVRAKYGGFLEFHVAPGEIVRRGDALATNTKLTGEDKNIVRAPRDGVILGMTTMPSVAPGDPVCHLAYPSSGDLRHIGTSISEASEEHLHEQVRAELASNLHVMPTDE